ncbi:MAG: class I tRNA ligase family protein, partial [Deltaproteobacteria bacterium]|nr:class I tRNA ligase family protein [Deltaproteobacteria bacterium]
SRQIWWGHQIPAWTCEECQVIIVAMETPGKCSACGGNKLLRETDVLDTWFSSALWPFSTMGWPEETPLLKRFYPTSVLVTGFDILFFWVARMMMMGIYFMGDVPFKDVYVHALVRDEHGKKMSKSKGNVIDPLTIIEKYGTDAFRFTLAAFAAQGRDIKMSEKRVEGYRHFVNKLWNAARFALMHIDNTCDSIEYDDLSLADRWILSRLNKASINASEAIESYRFNDAAGTLYKFVWHEFCDWYLEAVKPVLYDKEAKDKKKKTLSVLWRVLRDTIVLLHPFIPFVTEEIWSKLPKSEGSIMQAVFPLDHPDSVRINRDLEAETKMELVMQVISGIRNVRGEMNIAPSLALDVAIQSDDEIIRETINQYEDIIVNLAGLQVLSIEPYGKKPEKAATSVIEGATLFVSLEGVIDFAKETQRLEKEISKLTNELIPVLKKLKNENFLKKAPEDVVKKVKDKKNLLAEKQQKLQSTMDRIKALNPLQE